MWSDPPELPYLGEDYLADLDSLRAQRDYLFSSIRSWLNDFDEDWFGDSFDTFGRATDDIAKRRQAAWIKEAERFHKGIFPWHQAGLGRPGLMADFDYWGKMASFNVEEAALLSLGLDPKSYFKERLQVVERKDVNLCSADHFAVRRFEMFKRKFAPHGLPASVNPEKLTAWIRLVDLDAHPAFLRMIDNIERRSRRSNTTSSKFIEAEPAADEKPPESRILASLTKIIISMAIDGYGYVPGDKRSKIPKEIEGVMDRLGVSVSHETIRKYLRMGAEHLPDDD